MGIITFRGGVHPFEGKELSAQKPIQKLEPGPELVYLMSQHIGAPAKPAVKKGDHVLRGQMIAEAGGFVSAPVHASVSGTVKGIERRRNATGAWTDAVIIANDGKYEDVGYTPADPGKLSRQEILDRVRAAGVVGMGGAGFPTAVKLSPKDPSKVDYVLVNGSECEPYLTSDFRCMIEQPEKILRGLQIILSLFGESCRGVMCIEDNKPQAVEVMRKTLKEMQEDAAGAAGASARKTEDRPAGEGAAGSSFASALSRIGITVVKTKYPEGAERCLIAAVTGREVSSSMLPADAGCIVGNTQTVMAVYDAVAEGKPLTERVFTVSGDAAKDPKNFLVPVGMSYQEIIDAEGGFRTLPRGKAQRKSAQERSPEKPEPSGGCPEKIISGGPMMGFAIADLGIPVTKTSGALTCFLHDEIHSLKPGPCIRCGRCVQVCPARLMPCRLLDHAQHDEVQRFQDEYGMECVNCGCCSYVCPAKRPLAAEITALRVRILADRKKAGK